MAKSPSHIPARSRSMPESYYGRFDIKTTDDGSKQYSLPHTLGATIMELATGRVVLLAAAAIAWPCASIFPVKDDSSPLATTWVYAAFLFLGLHAAVTTLIALTAVLTGWRKVTRLTIRADGLIWNDHHFFPAHHIWRICYGTTTNADKPNAVFTPKIEIQVGVATIVLADGLDVPSAQLFERLFREDTRRYWHRHN